METTENQEASPPVNKENAKRPAKSNTSNDEKAPDSSDTNTQPKPKALKAKKRKKPKDSTAPRQPLSGYIRYLNDRRETVRTTNPSLSFAEITKQMANEWTNLAADKKQQYLDAAEQDKERYTREYNAYKQTEAYKIFTQQQNQEKRIREGGGGGGGGASNVNNKDEPAKINNLPQPTTPHHPAVLNTSSTTTTPSVTLKDPIINSSSTTATTIHQEMDFTNFDIPIFTEEFLDHNKTRDSELRQLRKSNTDYEQQNAILQKHIENMKDAITKLESEISQQEKNNASLQKHLDHLRVTLTNGFSTVKLPGIKEVATQQNIDTYMTNLHSILLENSSRDSNLLQTVRNIVGRLEFNG